MSCAVPPRCPNAFDHVPAKKLAQKKIRKTAELASPCPTTANMSRLGSALAETLFVEIEKRKDKEEPRELPLRQHGIGQISFSPDGHWLPASTHLARIRSTRSTCAKVFEASKKACSGFRGDHLGERGD